MVAPEVPTGGLIRQAVLHHEPNGQGHDAIGVGGLGRGQVGHVGREIAAASGTVMLGIGDLDVAGPAPQRVAQIMQGAGEDPVPGVGLAALRTGPMLVVSTAPDQLWGREHLRVGDAQSGVRRVDSRTKHDKVLPNQRLFSLILRLRPSSVIIKLPVVMLKSLASSGFLLSKVGQRRPTLDQLIRIAKALEVPIQRLLGGSDRPGTELREIAIELRHLGIVDLWVKDAVMPGAFRRAEEMIALAVAGHEPEPRIVEAIPAVLAWNLIDPILLRAYGLTMKPRTARRLAWLADVALAIDRRGGFPGGCHKEPLARLVRIIRAPSAERDRWDCLGRPMAKQPTSPIWRRWRIRYDANLDVFEQRARHLDELRGQLGVRLPSRRDQQHEGGRWDGAQ